MNARQGQHQFRLQTPCTQLLRDRLAIVPRQQNDVIWLFSYETLIVDDRDMVPRKVQTELDRGVLLANIWHQRFVDTDVIEQRTASAGTGVPDKTQPLVLAVNR